MMCPLLNIKQVSKLFNVSERTVHRMIVSKELPAFKIKGSWRFRKEDIQSILNGNK